MSYPKSLDEYSEADLLGELAKRKRLREAGKCDYCERPYKTSPCRFPERHRPPLRAPKVVQVFK
jgi:hypothetical protein